MMPPLSYGICTNGDPPFLRIAIKRFDLADVDKALQRDLGNHVINIIAVLDSYDHFALSPE